MKKRGLAVLIMVFFATAAFQCEETRECCVPPVCSEKPTLNGTWRLVAYENQTTGLTDNDPEPEGKGVVYTFRDNEKTGSVEGHTFANTITGAYKLGDGCALTITAFGGTKVGEPLWSNKAWLPSNKSGYYQIVGNRLVIYFNGTEERLVFERK
jgi:hypothetical protein